jgi:hypothetical protein
MPDDVYAEARAHFEEAELVRLTMVVIAINGWNRLNVAFRTEAGGYQPRPRAAAAAETPATEAATGGTR